MTNWPTKKLGEVIDVNFGERITRTNNSGNKYPVYGGGGESFRTDRFNRENEYVVSRFAIAENCVRFVEGKFWLMDSGGTFSIKNESTGKLDKKFVGNVLLMKQKEIYNCARGGAQKNIDVDFFKKIKIPLPPLLTQKQIVERLDKIAEAQKLNDGLIQKTDELFQSLLHKELNPAGPADASPSREATDEQGKAMADKKDWKVKKLGDIAETSSGGTPLKEKTEFYENGTIPWLRSGEVSQGLIYSSELSITEKGLKQSSAKIFPINTVLVAMYGATAGQIGLLKFEATTNQAICGIFPNDKFISEYLYYFLKTKTKYLIQISTGGAQPNISQAVIRNLKVPLPDLKTQKQIVAKLSAVQDYKKQLFEQKSKLKELFDSALSKSMNN